MNSRPVVVAITRSASSCERRTRCAHRSAVGARRGSIGSRWMGTSGFGCGSELNSGSCNRWRLPGKGCRPSGARSYSRAPFCSSTRRPSWRCQLQRGASCYSAHGPDRPGVWPTSSASYEEAPQRAQPLGRHHCGFRWLSGTRKLAVAPRSWVSPSPVGWTPRGSSRSALDRR